MTGQQTWIAVGVLIGFIVFITVRGELPAYLDILNPVSKTNITPVTQQTIQTGGLGGLGTVLGGIGG